MLFVVGRDRDFTRDFKGSVDISFRSDNRGYMIHVELQIVWIG